ncbi:DMT family transporter [Gluconobacter sp. Dm-44]|uniref:DMT family transporter n=1 Tax=Gluconobacter sp. Dm-44 TaxID=2799805 RepID=UPI001B8D35C5|nr:DMT family transporter [Gluconobacter sp. Dm-44]MBS1060416.1 DMT family transporter [Gluconobacter sp. Dm-44]
MNTFAAFAFIFVAGMLQAVGAVMNGALNKAMVNPWLATAISFLLVLFLALGLFACMPKPLPSTGDITQMPWWAPLGGITGAVAVFAGLLLIQKLGAGPMNGVTITANILASLLIDHFGLLHMEQHSLNPYRIVGAILMIAGVALIAKF